MLAFSDADLRAPFYTANADAGWISSGRVQPIFDSTDNATYFPSDFFDSLDDSTGSILSYRYAAIIDNFRSFLPALQGASLTQV